MKKKIVFAIDTLMGGGAERVVLTLADRMVDLEHNVHIIIFKKHRNRIEYPICLLYTSDAADD